MEPVLVFQRPHYIADKPGKDTTSGTDEVAWEEDVTPGTDEAASEDAAPGTDEVAWEEEALVEVKEKARVDCEARYGSYVDYAQEDVNALQRAEEELEGFVASAEEVVAPVM